MCRLGKSGLRACADKDVVVVSGSGASCGEQSTTVLPVGISLKLL